MKKILVIKLGALGDFIQALGPMQAIRKYHENDHITLLTTKPYVQMGQDCAYFDDVWQDCRPRWYQFREISHLRQRLNQGGFDRVYDLQNNDRTALYLRLLKNKGRPEWVGAAKGASHRNNSPDRIAGHAFDGHVQTLALAGIHDIELDRLDWMANYAGNLDDGFGVRQPYVLIVAGCSKGHPQKRWPVSSYCELANMYAKQGVVPVLIGTGDERDVNAEIKQKCSQAIDLTSQTSLYDIASLAKGAKATIGNDTGPMHIIAATGCPTATLYYAGDGGSDLNRHGTLGARVCKMMFDANDNVLNPETVKANLDAV